MYPSLISDNAGMTYQYFYFLIATHNAHVVALCPLAVTTIDISPTISTTPLYVEARHDNSKVDLASRSLTVNTLIRCEPFSFPPLTTSLTTYLKEAVIYMSPGCVMFGMVTRMNASKASSTLLLG
jgi:hypothetical protein